LARRCVSRLASGGAEGRTEEHGKKVTTENIDLTRAQYTRWNAEDFDAWIEGFDPDVEYFSSISAGLDGSGRYKGHDGMRRFLRDYLANWQTFQLEPREYIDRGPHVAVFLKALGRGRGSGVDVEREMAHVWTFSEGRVIRHRSFGSPDEALEAMDD
jgi:ketosteroid isomerase-like protein